MVRAFAGDNEFFDTVGLILRIFTPEFHFGFGHMYPQQPIRKDRSATRRVYFRR